MNNDKNTEIPSDDEEICLPSDTLKILQEFLAEKSSLEQSQEENWVSFEIFHNSWKFNRFPISAAIESILV